MSEFLSVLALALLPALGNFSGGLLAERFQASRRVVSIALHAAAGILLAVVGVELLPQVLEGGTPWLMILAFASGGGFFLVMDQTIDIVRKRVGRIQKRGTAAATEADEAANAGAWGIFFAVAVDLFTDGVLIGTGSTIAFGLGLLLALAQVPADIPEGFATIANFKRLGVPRRTRLLISAAFAVPIFLGATIGFWAVRGQPEVVKLALLAFTAGIITTVTVEEIVPEAHYEEEGRLATLGFVAGFALFALLSTYFG